jgi:hypothetical protein
MNSLGIDNIELANQLESELVVSGTEVPHELKLAPDASRCIGLAYNESREQGKEKIGSHHLLLVVLKGIKLKKRFAQLAMPPEMSTTNTSLKFRRKDQRATAIYVRTTTSFRKFVKTQAQPTG